MGRLKRETWKIHPIYTDYEVSDWGRVRRISPYNTTWVGRILKPVISKGYLIISLCKKGRIKNSPVHRAVLETFVGPCPESYQGNHKDGVKTNNFLSNLEWITPKENTIHSYKNGLQIPLKGEEHGNSKLKEGEVWLIRKLLSHKINQSKIAKMFRITQSTVSHIKCNKGWKHI